MFECCQIFFIKVTKNVISEDANDEDREQEDRSNQKIYRQCPERKYPSDGI